MNDWCLMPTWAIFQPYRGIASNDLVQTQQHVFLTDNIMLFFLYRTQKEVKRIMGFKLTKYLSSTSDLSPFFMPIKYV